MPDQVSRARSDLRRAREIKTGQVEEFWNQAIRNGQQLREVERQMKAAEIPEQKPRPLRQTQ
jgi:hypothetical protein